ncbi:peptidase inhibitor family I36 protein [Streptomyces sp. H10-C2]|uniref:peptidase inhibitor family I36 protein n=1 Tax=unclassified Streptomyces TaxID=2593676 RepID=UPI0024BBE99F|nr:MULTISPECIES: peptidase inhibitor family I36 protein [unclassified Streptomyces]MDJ0346453.1 peptidase inhibitor family I36 protein [Streptomyces sp. PH10-H1]MDJ0374392.1 peptidase inhibitor family I36 protein [Streptomyces sp. H10-C2]
MKLRSWSCAAVLSLTALLLPTSNAVAASAAPPFCPVGSICFYSGTDFSGQSWEWASNSGYRDMPPGLHDNVSSFVASTDACFINWDPKETRQVRSGDWRRDYGGDFGGRIDGVNGGNC